MPEAAVSDTALPAATVIIARDGAMGLEILAIERARTMGFAGGAMAFPGGKVDPEDASVVDAALREAQEEVGLDPGCVEVLGPLSTYVTGSSFIITPIVGLVRPDAVLQANPHEVADVFEVPLAFLLDPAHHRHHVVEWGGVRREWFSMPYQDGDKNRFIWGATAGMLRNFYRFMRA